MSETSDIQPGSQVLMHYRITLEDGTVADSSFEGEPLRFTMGDGTLIQGLELALYGLRAGDRQSLGIDPQYAFGLPDETAIQTLPRTDFPADMQLEAGQIIAFGTPEGEEIPGAILEVGDKDVKVDFNHPLAGHEIQFEVEILDVRPPAGGEAD